MWAMNIDFSLPRRKLIPTASNVRTSSKGVLGWSGSHPAAVQQRLQNTPAPAASGKGCVWSGFNDHFDSMMCLSGSRHAKQCELLSEGGCTENATTQLKLFGAYKEGNQEEVGK